MVNDLIFHASNNLHEGSRGEPGSDGSSGPRGYPGPAGPKGVEGISGLPVTINNNFESRNNDPLFNIQRTFVGHPRLSWRKRPTRRRRRFGPAHEVILTFQAYIYTNLNIPVRDPSEQYPSDHHPSDSSRRHYLKCAG